MGARDLLADLRGAGLSVNLIDGKIIVAPKGKLTDPIRDAVRANKPELVAALSPASSTPSATPRPDLRRLPSLCRQGPGEAPDRPHRLTKEQGDACHAGSWEDAEIAAFTARAARFVQMGKADAEDLAERLTLRDRESDERRLCLECSWLGDSDRCIAAATGRLLGTDRRLQPVQTVLQRCPAFGLRKGLE